MSNCRDISSIRLRTGFWIYTMKISNEDILWRVDTQRRESWLKITQIISRANIRKDHRTSTRQDPRTHIRENLRAHTREERKGNIREDLRINIRERLRDSTEHRFIHRHRRTWMRTIFRPNTSRSLCGAILAISFCLGSRSSDSFLQLCGAFLPRISIEGIMRGASSAGWSSILSFLQSSLL